MTEPQPSGVHEGASTPPAPPAAASAAAEAAALSSLDNKTLSDASSAPKKEVDLKALNDAMKALDSGVGGKKASAATAVGGTKKDEEPAKLIKVDAADVSLLVSVFNIWADESLNKPDLIFLLTLQRARPTSWISRDQKLRNC